MMKIIKMMMPPLSILNLSIRLVLLVFVFQLLQVYTVGVYSVTNFSRLDFPFPPHFVFGSGTSAYQVSLYTYSAYILPSVPQK